MNTTVSGVSTLPGALDLEVGQDAKTSEGTGISPVGTGLPGCKAVQGAARDPETAPGFGRRLGSEPASQAGSTDDVRLAAVNAALWLREETRQRGLLSLTAGFREGLTVIYRDGAGATVLLSGAPPVALGEAALDAELDAWAVPA